MKKIVLLAVFILGITHSYAKTYVFVHGAMGDATAWFKMIAPLEKEGHTVIVINLPSHGKDATPISEVTYDSYIKTITDSIDRIDEKVILVGHSMAGLLISSVAEKIPESIESLVFVAAFVPKSGDSVFKLNGGDTNSQFGKNIIVSEDQASATLKLDKIKEVFCNYCSDAEEQLLILSHKAQPLAPLAQEISLSDKFNATPKYIVQTTDDNAITFSLQQSLTENAKNVKKVFKIKSGHSPFLTKPKKLAKILLSF